MKPRACSKCGAWYNPKFQGTEELCGKCLLKEKMLEVESDKQKVKNEPPNRPAAEELRTNHRPEPRMRFGSEFRGTCKKCGLWIEGSEVYNRERGWVYEWVHVDYDRSRRRYCLVA
jgi:hypothetical protein